MNCFVHLGFRLFSVTCRTLISAHLLYGYLFIRLHVQLTYNSWVLYHGHSLGRTICSCMESEKGCKIWGFLSQNIEIILYWIVIGVLCSQRLFFLKHWETLFIWSSALASRKLHWLSHFSERKFTFIVRYFTK